jgi:lipoate---protein ligase
MWHMRLLDLILPTPAENLALDEALLEEAEAFAQPLETLRLWEPLQNFVVVGRSSHVDVEVNRAACRELGIPIFRRVSGGAAIVTGPGCLMYSLILSYEKRPNLRTVNQAHAFVLGMLQKALVPLVPDVCFCGTSDLAVALKTWEKGTQLICRNGPEGASHKLAASPFPTLKFSGNSMRCRKRHFLYHGTFLYNFPLELISRCLKTPPRMPDYRNGREHKMFVANLPLSAESIRQALISTWNADEPVENWPRELTNKLATKKYGKSDWNEKI